MTAVYSKIIRTGTLVLTAHTLDSKTGFEWSDSEFHNYV